MKRILILSLLLVAPFLAIAQVKVLESSAKKAPAWIVSVGSNYFVGTAIGSTLEEAKEICFADIKKQIISAIAENIKSSSSQTTTQTTAQNDIVDFLESFNSSFETRSAIVPFLNGISMSRVEDFYYEKSFNKANGSTTYSYSMLFPFSNGELQVLIKKFMAQDQQMERILNEQIAKIGNINSTEEIDRAIAALTPLLDYFFDDIRISKTKQAIEQFRKMYTYVSIELVSSTPGEMVYAMLAEGRPISTAVKPTFRSNCAMGLMYNDMGNGMVKVTYDSEGCMAEDNNYIEVSYRLPYSPIKKQMFPTMTSSPLKIAATGTLNIKVTPKATEEPAVEEPTTEPATTEEEPKVEVVEKPNFVELDGLNIEFQLNNRSSATAKVKSLTLQIGEFSSTINIMGLDIDVAQGVSAINVAYDKPLKMKEMSQNQKSSSLSFTKGSVSIMNPANGKVQTVPVVVKYTIE